MEIPILSVEINNEMDIMLAHRRGMQFAKLVEIGLSEQTRFATAVSEICRNSLEYACEAAISFSITALSDTNFLSAVIKDKGNGIPHLPQVLERRPEEYKGRGLGIVYARKLVDSFRITSNPNGTAVYLQMKISARAGMISKATVQGWVKRLADEPAISPYEELKLRNTQLVELSEELKSNASLVDRQLKEIQKLNDQLSKTNARLKEFTYAISHDLKTPLSSLKIAADHLQHNQEGEDIVAYKAILSRSVHRLDKTIHSLIEILDMQNQDKQIVRALDFNDLFSEIKEEFETIIGECGASIHTDFTAAPRIHHIEAYIQSLFRNLLSNALKYKDPVRPLFVRATTELEGNNIRFRFSDTGSGMDMNRVKSRLFTPFTRFSNHSDGKGIGLYMVKGMVESNGGTVIVESELEKGTTFIVTLVPYY
jgi:signal transduction histidine kinase